MKIFISLCLILLITLSHSKYGPVSWARCPEGPNTWIPLYTQITQDPNLKELITFSAGGVIANSRVPLDFQSLWAIGSIEDYAWNSTSPYVHQSGGQGHYFALNYTTLLPSLNKTSVFLTMRGLGTNGDELACINIWLVNQTKISI